MKTVRMTACLCAGIFAGSALLFGADTAAPASSTDAAILERLAALERRFDELAAENKALRDQLAAAQAAKPTAAAVATSPAPAPAPAAEPAKPAKPAAIYVAAAGKEEKISLGGFFHINAESGDAPDARWAGIHDRFFIRRARLNATGSFADDFSFKIEGDFGNNSVGGRSGYSAQMTDGYVTWSHYPAASLRAGQFKSPFGYEQLLSDTKVQTVERSLPNDRLTISRQIGVGLFGDIVPKRFAYSTGIFNGNGVNNGDNDNDDFLYVGRVSGTILSGGKDDGKFQLDAGLNAFTMDTTGTVAQRDGLGADLQFTWGKATINAEWLRNDFTSSTGVESDSDGWALLGTWMFDKHWLVMARVENFDPSSLAANDATDSWTLGGAYLINGDNLKLTLNYMQGTVGNGDSNSRILGRLQLVY
jgi:phosphate-selective porin